MKATRSTLLAILTFGPPVILGFIGCSKSDNSKAAVVVQDMKKTATDVADDVKSAAIDTWGSIKDFTYDRRADFSARFNRMADSMDAKVADLRSKAAGVPDAASRDRDAALKDYDAARADLSARMTDLGNATADTWADAKARVDAAWQRMKVAYDKAVS